MSQYISTAHVNQYNANVNHLVQQKGSFLRALVRNEMQKGVTAFYDQIGAVTAQAKGSRHSDTPQIDTPHERRAVTLTDYNWADLIDTSDKIRMLTDPTSKYVEAAVWALGRSMDDVIIAAARGTSATGVAGGTNVALPNSQKLVSVKSAAGANLNLDALRKAKYLFDKADVDPSLKRYFAITASQLQALLAETEVASSDYNAVKALVDGKLTTFMGFEFVMINRLVKQSSALAFDTATGAVGTGSGAALNYRSCLAWAQDGVLLATGESVTTKVSERDDKNYSTQCYAEMSIGATRMEEVKVVEVLCNEA